MGRQRPVGGADFLKADAVRQVVEEAHASAEEVRRNVDEDLVDQVRAERLLAGRRPTQLHMLVPGDSPGLADRALDSVRHELQVRRALRDALGRRRAMRQHE
jgi:hypothetical protein